MYFSEKQKETDAARQTQQNDGNLRNKRKFNGKVYKTKEKYE